ncbi:MAG: flavodoxin family protein [Promethearchaeota archaeon]|jgi:flavodoxin
MKILVTYYSQNGNTEKVARSICEGCEGQEVEIKPIKELNPSTLSDYDLLFLGSGIYASRVNKSLADLIDAATELPPKIVFFNTHASKKPYQDGFKVVKSKIGESSEIIAEFDCCGDNIGIPEAMRNSMLERLPPEKRKEAEEHQQWLKGRPNAEDLENAKQFALSLIRNI